MYCAPNVNYDPEGLYNYQILMALLINSLMCHTYHYLDAECKKRVYVKPI